MHVFAMYEKDGDIKPPFHITTKEEARDYNSKGFGIFWAFNKFKNSERRIENLEEINYWAVDIDDGSKEEQWKRIDNASIVPSVIIETKKGFHVYYKAKQATLGKYSEIVQDRLIPMLGGDIRARDPARLLRMPGYTHWKDSKNPFIVGVKWQWDVSYTEEQMLRFLEAKADKVTNLKIKGRQELREVFGESKYDGTDLWERIYKMNCIDALERLSGAPELRGEVFTFKLQRNGNNNIFVNGKGTSCWVDRDGHIGSLDKGGLTPFNYIKWYGYTNKETVEIMKRYFPELPWTK